MTTPAFRRIVRRETHSPRTVAMIVAVVLLILGLAYVGVEIVLHLLAAARPAARSRRGRRRDRRTADRAARAARDRSAAWCWPCSGWSSWSLGLTPGRLSEARHGRRVRAVVVDNGVVAASHRAAHQRGDRHRARRHHGRRFAPHRRCRPCDQDSATRTIRRRSPHVVDARTRAVRARPRAEVARARPAPDREGAQTDERHQPRPEPDRR